jgi:hypothetical protein
MSIATGRKNIVATLVGNAAEDKPSLEYRGQRINRRLDGGYSVHLPHGVRPAGEGHYYFKSLVGAKRQIDQIPPHLLPPIVPD